MIISVASFSLGVGRVSDGRRLGSFLLVKEGAWRERVDKRGNLAQHPIRRIVMATTYQRKHSGHEHPRPRTAQVVDDIVAELAELGYRDTEPRRLVISAAAAQSRPFTAEELCSALPCVGRATVYRGLRLLVETEQVCRVLLEDRELRYQLSHQGHHHHMLCAVCGASADLAGARRGRYAARSRRRRWFPDERALAGSVRPLHGLFVGLRPRRCFFAYGIDT